MCDNRVMAVIELVDAIPLAKDAHGVYRVGGTRVTLDIVVRAFNRGATAKEIVQEFPSLQLPDVYQVIGYYLKHSAELAAYFEKREREEKDIPVIQHILVNHHPASLFGLLVEIQLACQVPQMLAGVIKIDNLNGTGKQIGRAHV